MGASGKAFDEVKQILGRLDRSIDEARTKRLGPAEPDPAPAAPSDRPIGAPQRPAPATLPATPQRRTSKYGRAKPLRRSDDAPASDPSNVWVDRSRAQPQDGEDGPLIG